MSIRPSTTVADSSFGGSRGLQARIVSPGDKHNCSFRPYRHIAASHVVESAERQPWSFSCQEAGRPASPQPAENTRKKLFINFADNFAHFPHNHYISPNPGIPFWRRLLFRVWGRLELPGRSRDLQSNDDFKRCRPFRISDLQKQAPRNSFTLMTLAKRGRGGE